MGNLARCCAMCPTTLEHHRAHAVYCSGACRAEASRLRRLAAGKPVDGYASVADRLSVAGKRTYARHSVYSAKVRT